MSHPSSVVHHEWRIEREGNVPVRMVWQPYRLLVPVPCSALGKRGECEKPACHCPPHRHGAWSWS